MVKAGNLLLPILKTLWLPALAIGSIAAVGNVVLSEPARLTRLLEPKHPVGYDRLMEAIDSNNVGQAELILKAGANPNAFPDESLVSSGGYTSALVAALEKRNGKLVDLLLRYGASPGLVDGNGEKPLIIAAEKDELPVIASLVKHGAKVNDSLIGSAALAVAVWKGSAESVAFLLDHGANPNTQIAGVGSLLRELKQSRTHPEMVRLLVQHGAKDRWTLSAGRGFPSASHGYDSD